MGAPDPNRRRSPFKLWWESVYFTLLFWTSCSCNWIVDAIVDCWIQVWQAIELVNYDSGLLCLSTVKYQKGANLRIPIYLHPRKSYKLQGASLSDPLTRDSAPGPRWGLRPQTPVIESRSRARHGLKPSQSNFFGYIGGGKLHAAPRIPLWCYLRQSISITSEWQMVDAAAFCWYNYRVAQSYWLPYAQRSGEAAYCFIGVSLYV